LATPSQNVTRYEDPVSEGEPVMPTRLNKPRTNTQCWPIKKFMQDDQTRTDGKNHDEVSLCTRHCL
jgi:hypothetical protein